MAASLSPARGPYIEIVEQPRCRGARFRYKSEGACMRNIVGVLSSDVQHTFPAIQIRDAPANILVVVRASLVQKDPVATAVNGLELYSPHPHLLTGTGCDNGVCTVEANSGVRISFPKLGIQCCTRKSIVSNLQERYSLGVDPFNIGESWNNSGNVDMKLVRLCFEATLFDANRRPLAVLTPVVSDVIIDRKCDADLKICQVDHSSSPANGGQQIFILCTKLNKDDKVQFYEEINGVMTWHAWGDFSPTDIHKQYAIVLKTPPYKNRAIANPVTVRMRIVRPATQEYGDDIPFQYQPVDDDPYHIKRKRLEKKFEFSDFPIINVLKNDVIRDPGIRMPPPTYVAGVGLPITSPPGSYQCPIQSAMQASPPFSPPQYVAHRAIGSTASTSRVGGGRGCTRRGQTSKCQQRLQAPDQQRNITGMPLMQPVLPTIPTTGLPVNNIFPKEEIVEGDEFGVHQAMFPCNFSQQQQQAHFDMLMANYAQARINAGELQPAQGQSYLGNFSTVDARDIRLSTPMPSKSEQITYAPVVNAAKCYGQSQTHDTSIISNVIRKQDTCNQEIIASTGDVIPGDMDFACLDEFLLEHLNDLTSINVPTALSHAPDDNAQSAVGSSQHQQYGVDSTVKQFPGNNGQSAAGSSQHKQYGVDSAVKQLPGNNGQSAVGSSQQQQYGVDSAVKQFLGNNGLSAAGSSQQQQYGVDSAVKQFPGNNGQSAAGSSQHQQYAMDNAWLLPGNNRQSVVNTIHQQPQAMENNGLLPDINVLAAVESTYHQLYTPNNTRQQLSAADTIQLPAEDEQDFLDIYADLTNIR